MSTGIFSSDRFLLIGPPKAGKSSMAASFPRPFIINTDGPTNDRDIYKKLSPGCIVHSINSFEGFESALRTAAKRKSEWETLVMDVLEDVTMWADDALLDNLRKKHRNNNYLVVGDVEHGIGWDSQFHIFRSLLANFWKVAERNGSCSSSIIVAHTTRQNGRETVSLRSRLVQYLTGKVQHIGFVVKAKNGSGGLVYSVDFGGSSCREAGSRIQAFQDAGLITPPTYDTLVQLYKTGEFTPGLEHDDDELKIVVGKSVKKEQFKKALAWAESKGIDRKELKLYAERKQLSNRDVYDLLVSVRIQGKVGKLARDIEKELS